MDLISSKSLCEKEYEFKEGYYACKNSEENKLTNASDYLWIREMEESKDPTKPNVYRLENRRNKPELKITTYPK